MNSELFEKAQITYNAKVKNEDGTVNTAENISVILPENIKFDYAIKPKTVNEARRDYVQKKVKDKKAEEKRETEKAYQEHTSAPTAKENYQYNLNNEITDVKTKDDYNPNGKITT